MLHPVTEYLMAQRVTLKAIDFLLGWEVGESVERWFVCGNKRGFSRRAGRKAKRELNAEYNAGRPGRAAPFVAGGVAVVILSEQRSRSLSRRTLGAAALYVCGYCKMWHVHCVDQPMNLLALARSIDTARSDVWPIRFR